MAKKSKFAKVVVALGAIGVASKIAYDKYKNVKDDLDRKSTRLNSSHYQQSRMPSSA